MVGAGGWLYSGGSELGAELDRGGATKEDTDVSETQRHEEKNIC